VLYGRQANCWQAAYATLHAFGIDCK